MQLLTVHGHGELLFKTLHVEALFRALYLPDIVRVARLVIFGEVALSASRSLHVINCFLPLCPSTSRPLPGPAGLQVK